MNTAIAEGHDLAWKLAWVLRGWASPALLDTYLDLLGSGLTLLAGPIAEPWTAATAALVPPYPLDVQAVDASTAPTDPAAELAGWTRSRWFERQPVSS